MVYYFISIVAASAPIHAFLESLLSVLRTMFFSKPLAAFPQNHYQTMVIGGRGMNSVAITIINPRKGIDPVGYQSHDPLSSSPIRYRQSYRGSACKGAGLLINDKL